LEQNAIVLPGNAPQQPTEYSVFCCAAASLIWLTIFVGIGFVLIRGVTV
jgi:hypothetical protein